MVLEEWVPQQFGDVFFYLQCAHYYDEVIQVRQKLPWFMINDCHINIIQLEREIEWLEQQRIILLKIEYEYIDK